MKFIYVFLLVLLNTVLLNAQEKQVSQTEKALQDSLKTYFNTDIDKYIDFGKQLEFYYIKQNNFHKLIDFYLKFGGNLTLKGKFDVAQPYIDKAIEYAKQIRDNEKLGSAFIAKAAYNYYKKDYITSIKYFSKADSIATTDKRKMVILRNYAFIKKDIGDLEGAVDIYKKIYYKLNNDETRLKFIILLDIVNGYKDYLDKYQDRPQYADSLQHYLSLAEKFRPERFMDQSQLKLTKLSIELDRHPEKGDSIIREFDKIKSHLHHLDIHVFDNAIHFDKAKYYYKKKAYQTALLHLDSILSTDTQSGFSYSYKDEVENLYARILKDMGKTEEALEKTMALNRMMQEQNRHRILVDKILRDRYDYRVIKAKIKHLETRILAESQTNRWLLLGIIISSGLILILIYRRKLLKDGYEITLTDLRNKQEKLEEEIEKSKQKILKSAQNQAGIESKTSKPRQLPSEKILRGMIERLKDFENKKEYLKPEVDLGYLAKYLKSNKTYTSLVVKEYSGMSFKDYINKLRIEYSIHLMYNDIDYVSNLNIEGMAVEVGYTTSKPYRMAFKKITGSHPSYFIKQVKKSKKN